jgi:hypothetical protein
MASDPNTSVSSSSSMKEKIKGCLSEFKSFLVQLYDPLLIKAIIIPTAGIIITAILGLLFRKFFVFNTALPFLTVVAGFYVFLRMFSYKSQKLFIYPSPVALGVSAVAFFVACVAGKDWCLIGLTIGTLTGLFFRVDFEEFRQLMLSNSKAAIVAVIGALAGPLFILSQKIVWTMLAYVSVGIVYMLVFMFTSQVDVMTKRDLQETRGQAAKSMKQIAPQVTKMAKNSRENFVAVVSDNFALRYTATSNALEGVMLFVFMFSVLAIINWQTFQNISMLKAVGIGIGCVIVGNALLTAGLYLVADHVTPEGFGESWLRRTIALSHNYHTLNFLVYLAWCSCVLRMVYKKYIAPAARR